MKRNGYNNILLSFLYILIILDYVLTYYGVNILKVIEEANPLMIKFMELPFIPGIYIRCLIGLFLISLLKISEQKLIYSISFRNLLFTTLIIQIFPYVKHSIWIYRYLRIIYF